MPKRKSRKVKKPSLQVKSGLSKRTYETLKKEGERARARIAEFSKRPDADFYIVPRVEDYRLDSLINRLINGESVRAVLKEVRNTTAAQIKSGVASGITLTNKEKLSTSEYRQAVREINQVNKNIREATKKFSDFKSIFPSEFNAEDLISDLPSRESVKERINTLKRLFTPENLIPVAINEDGEAGTKAEYEYLRSILEKENERRAKQRESRDPTKNKGYIRQQFDVDVEPIDIDKIPDMEKLRRRATTWDDPARNYRSNLFITNYLTSFEKMEASMIMTGFLDKHQLDQFKKTKKIIKSFYNREDAIDYISSHFPSIDVYLNYQVVKGEASLDEIFLDWINADYMFNK